MVKWVDAQQIPNSFTTSAIEMAARGGHLEIVQYLLMNRSEGFTGAAVANAIVGGRYEVCELERIARADRRVPSIIMREACISGQLHVVQWLVQHAKMTCVRPAMQLLLENGHLHILEWIHHHDPHCEGWSVDAMTHAAHGGHLTVVQWLHANRQGRTTTAAVDYAAGKGHMQVVEWLHMNRAEGCASGAITRVAAGGHLSMVQWLLENRTEGGFSDAMVAAASINQYMSSNGSTLNERTVAPP